MLSIFREEGYARSVTQSIVLCQRVILPFEPLNRWTAHSPGYPQVSCLYSKNMRMRHRRIIPKASTKNSAAV